MLNVLGAGDSKRRLRTPRTAVMGEAMRNTCVPLLICLLLAGSATSAIAKCVMAEPFIRRAKDRASLVFEGTVTEVYDSGVANELVATIDVQRVWKGDVGQRVSVYFVPSYEGPNFDTGRRTIVFARPQTPDLRKLANLPEDAPHRTNWVPLCEGAVDPSEAVIKELGRSHVPSR
jgi:hypothetical protein